MLLTVAILVDRSVIMLIEIGIKEQKYNFEDLALHLLGVHGYYVTLLFMFIFAYGAQIAYMVIIGDTIPIFLENSLGYSVNREIVMVTFATIIILPLCLLKNLSSLSKTSFVSILSDIFIVIIVVINSYSKAQKQDASQSLNGMVYININIFAGIGTMAFAFVCQHNSFLVYKSLKEPTIENWKFVAHFSITISFLISLTLGIFGYLAFKDKTNGDILTNFSSDNSLINFARFLLALCMTFVFPMECYVSRHCLLSLASNISTKSPTNIFSSLTKSPLHINQDDPNAVFYISSNDHNQSEQETDDSNQTAHFITDNLKRNVFAFFLWLSSVSIAISDKNLGDVLSFTGINVDKF
jgi:sodium-coupled neutral amino acid transporter 11